MNIATNLRRLMDERDLTPARLSERLDAYLRGELA